MVLRYTNQQIWNNWKTWYHIIEVVYQNYGFLEKVRKKNHKSNILSTFLHDFCETTKHTNKIVTTRASKTSSSGHVTYLSIEREEVQTPRVVKCQFLWFEFSMAIIVII